MGLLDWLWPRPQTTTAAVPQCDFCADPVAADLDEIAADGDRAIYLCRCPRCGQHWSGHGCAPQIRWALTPQEAAEVFPDAFRPVQ